MAKEFTEDGKGFGVFRVRSHCGIAFGIVGSRTEWSCEFCVHAEDDLGLIVIGALCLFSTDGGLRIG